MGEAAFMKQQKLAEGFTCVKLKIETIDFEKELIYYGIGNTQNRLKSGRC
jgi:hypothetical protein